MMSLYVDVYSGLAYVGRLISKLYSPLQSVSAFQGYRTCTLGHGKLPFTRFCLAKLTPILIRLVPGLAIKCFLVPCPITQASFVQATLENEEKILRKVHRSVLHEVASPAASCKAFSSPRQAIFGGRTASTKMLLGKDPILFKLGEDFLQFCATKQAFIRIPDVPDDLPGQLIAALQALEGIEKGGSWVSLNAAEAWNRRHRMLLYGNNDNTVSVPSLPGLFFADLLQPVLIVQFLKMPLWMYLFRYYVYPSVLVAVVLAGQGMCAYLAHHKAKNLASLTTHTRLVPFVNRGYVRAMKARHLVPGDIIVVVQGPAVCDMVLLRGNCLVEESVLSGEVLQTRKAPFVRSSLAGSPQAYHPDTHASCTVLAGFRIQQVWNDQCETDETLAMVIRTGNRTAVGSTLRSNAHETKTLANHVSFKDGPKFGVLSTCAQMVLLITIIPTLIKYHFTARFICSQLFLVLLNAVPPLLPAASAMLGVRTILRMRQQDLHVADPQKLLAGAQIDMLLFDKTGTLTVGQGYLRGVVEWESGQLSPMRSEPIMWSNNIRSLLALCNDLTPLSRDKVSGPEDEVKIFKKIEAAFVSRNSVCLPQRLSNQTASTKLVRMDILLRLEYNPMVLMSGAIARAEHAKQDSAQLFIKGAPFEVAALVGFAALPQGWGAAMAHWTGLGYRVLGLAVGKLLPATAADKQQLSRLTLLTLKQHVSDLRMIGLAIIETQVRADAAATIKQLHDRAGVQPVMVTGDHYLTATAVAKGISLITTKQHVILGKMPAMPPRPADPSATAPVTAPVSGASSAVLPTEATQPSSKADPEKHQVTFAEQQGSGSSGRRQAAPAALGGAPSGASVQQSAEQLKTALLKASVQPYAEGSVGHLAQSAVQATAEPPLQAAVRSSTGPALVQLPRKGPGGASAMSRAFALAKSSAAAGAASTAASTGPESGRTPVTALKPPKEMSLEVHAESSAVAPADTEAQSSSGAVTTTPAADFAKADVTYVEAAQRASFEGSTKATAGVAMSGSPSSSSKDSAAVHRPPLCAPASASSMISDKTVQQFVGLASAAFTAHSGQAEAPKPSKALDLFGNEVPRLDEQTSTQLAAADASSGVITDSGIKSPAFASSAAANVSSVTAVDAHTAPHGKATNSLNQPEPAVASPTADISAVGSDRNVLLSAAVQSSALYAQLTCVIATSEDVKMVPAAQAFAAAAEGSQCIITGAVFEFLLEHAEPAVLETILRATVAYGRMKSHQKAQLVNLLGREGLKTAAGRQIQGLGHVIGYAGDGINDVEALRTADVGIAIGTRAIIAASIYTPANSLQVVCGLLKETRCSIMIAYTLNKYLILYGFVRMLTNTVTVYSTQREVSNTEYELMDFCTMAMSIAFILARPSRELHAVPRPRKLLSAVVLAPMLQYATLYAIQHGVAQVLIKRACEDRPEYYKGLSASAAALIGTSQLLVPAISFFKDMWPHTAGFDHNWIVLGVYVNCSILAVAWTLFPNLFATSHGAVWYAFSFSFRWQFLILIVSTNILAILLSNVRRCLQSRRWVHGSSAVFPVSH